MGAGRCSSPGPDNLMVLGIGIPKGRRQGIAFGLGCAPLAFSPLSFWSFFSAICVPWPNFPSTVQLQYPRAFNES
jgi:threonine/homoserine/homoserine lactone efflux protein